MIKLISAYCQLLLIVFCFSALWFSVWSARRQLWAEWRLIPRSYLLGLVFLILVPAVFYTYGMVPKHVIEDEAYYQLAAKNILTSGHLGDLPKSGGWAFLIFLGYLLESINNYVSIQISQCLGAGAIVGIFFLAVWAGLSLRTALIGAALFALVPARMFWAATGESHTASIFFVIWAAAFSFLCYRRSHRQIFWLAVSVWVFAGLVRSETVLIGLFFLLCMPLFVPRPTRKDLPIFSALCWSAMILMPQMIQEIRHALQGHWVVTGSNISVENLLHNTAIYGTGFLIGQVHPVLLTLLAMLGFGVIFRRERKLAVVLTGWLFLLPLMYFSIWFQNYGESAGILMKTRLFVFFYPPLVLFAAGGIVWLADKYGFRHKVLAAAGLCGIVVAWSCFYYRHYPLGKDQFVLEMRMVDEIKQTVSPKDLAVACFPQAFTGVLPSLMATDIGWFLQEPVWRRTAFQKAHKVYLIDDMYSQRKCRESVALIKQKGKAVVVQQWTQKKVRYGVYSLAGF